MTLLDIALQGIFWVCLGALIHSYVLYPALVTRWARAKADQKIEEPELPPDPELPHLVVVMAAHNEEAVLPATLESILQADYSRDRMEILVAADNCSDRTHEIVESFATDHENLTLRVFPGRNGKIKVINQIVEDNRDRWHREGDYLLILCDANVRWHRELPRRLAAHYRDSQIGLVAPAVLDERDNHEGIADYEEAYVNRENAVKHAEGILWGRMMGAFGACFSMRGRLFEEVPGNVNDDDFHHTMRCFEQGFDAVVEPEALCFEDVSEDISVEFRRKSRIAIGNFVNLRRFLPLFTDPVHQFGTFFAFWSHKGIRWFGPFLLLSTLLSSAVLAPQHPLYALAFLGQMASIGVAAFDSLLSRRGHHHRLPRALRYFYLMNLALLIGAFRYLSGQASSVWEPTQRVATESHAMPPSSITRPTESTSAPSKAANPSETHSSRSS